MRQQDAAEQLGVGYRTYQSWEEGRATPQGTNLERLARFFGVSPDDILADAPRTPVDHVNARLDRLQASVDDLLARLTAAGF